MIYYKVIQDGTIIDVNYVFLCWQERHDILLVCDAEDGQFIQSSDGATVWRVAWLNRLPDSFSQSRYADTETVEAVEIELSEYEILKASLDSGETVIEEPEDEDQETEQTYDETKELTIEFVRSAKLTEISKACNAVIEAGTDVETSNGVAHFNLTAQDQINVSNLFNVVLLGGTEYIYQSDGGVCAIYTATDIATIYITTQLYITGQTTYHNLLKQYVEGLETIEEIAAVTYGQDLTGEYLVEYQEKMALVQGQMAAIVASMTGGDGDG